MLVSHRSGQNSPTLHSHPSSPPDYSQCVPGAASSPPVTTSTPTATPTSPGQSSTSSTPTSTSTGATPTGSQIRADQDPVYHFYLQNDCKLRSKSPRGGSLV